MSLEAMRAAVTAIRAGVFDCPLPAGEAGPHVARSLAGWPWPPPGEPAVVILAGHAGAGASTVALAVAEALSGARPVQLVECTPPHRSGLVAASSVELGVDDVGWRRGRRGSVEIVRPAAERSPLHLPERRTARQDHRGDPLLILDGGTVTDPLVLSIRTWATDGPIGLVVVTRPTVPGLRQTQHVLASFGSPATVVVVGPRRWPRAVAASCGPAVREARETHRLVTVPLDRRLETTGLTPDPLPRPVAAAGRAIAGLLSLDQLADPAPSTSPGTPDQPAVTP